MDEEGYFDADSALKCAKWCENEDFLIQVKGQKPSFANGYINYTKQDTPDSYFFTFVDAIRIADD